MRRFTARQRPARLILTGLLLGPVVSGQEEASDQNAGSWQQVVEEMETVEKMACTMTLWEKQSEGEEKAAHWMSIAWNPDGAMESKSWILAGSGGALGSRVQLNSQIWQRPTNHPELASVSWFPENDGRGTVWVSRSFGSVPPSGAWSDVLVKRPEGAPDRVRTETLGGRKVHIYEFGNDDFEKLTGDHVGYTARVEVWIDAESKRLIRQVCSDMDLGGGDAEPPARFVLTDFRYDDEVDEGRFLVPEKVLQMKATETWNLAGEISDDSPPAVVILIDDEKLEVAARDWQQVSEKIRSWNLSEVAQAELTERTAKGRELSIEVDGETVAHGELLGELDSLYWNAP